MSRLCAFSGRFDPLCPSAVVTGPIARPVVMFHARLRAARAGFRRSSRRVRYSPCVFHLSRLSNVLVALAILAVLAPGTTYAQMLAGAAVGASRQTAGESSLPSFGLPFGGTAVATLGLIDFTIGRRATIGGEVSVAGSISGQQSQRTSVAANTFVSRHHDSVFSGVLKVGTPIDAPVRAAVAVGAGPAFRHTARTGTTGSLFPPGSRMPFSETVSDLVFSYSIGGDVEVRVARRVGVLAVARWYQLRDNDRQSDGVVKRGVSSTIVRYGFGAAVRF